MCTRTCAVPHVFPARNAPTQGDTTPDAGNAGHGPWPLVVLADTFLRERTRDGKGAARVIRRVNAAATMQPGRSLTKFVTGRRVETRDGSSSFAVVSHRGNLIVELNECTIVIQCTFVVSTIKRKLWEIQYI